MKYNNAMFCSHANECPVQCPCDLDCYCKQNTCKTTKIKLPENDLDKPGEFDNKRFECE